MRRPDTLTRAPGDGPGDGREDEPVPADAERRFWELVARREAHEPFQYIVGVADFRGVLMEVAHDVFLPRLQSERLCDEIVIIDHGRILARGTPQALIDQHVKGHVFEVQKPLPRGFRDGRFEQEDIGDAILYYVETPRGFTQELPEEVVYWHREANLEDVFLRLTGRQLRDK